MGTVWANGSGRAQVCLVDGDAHGDPCRRLVGDLDILLGTLAGVHLVRAAVEAGELRSFGWYGGGSGRERLVYAAYQSAPSESGVLVVI